MSRPDLMATLGLPPLGPGSRAGQPQASSSSPNDGGAEDPAGSVSTPRASSVPASAAPPPEPSAPRGTSATGGNNNNNNNSLSAGNSRSGSAGGGAAAATTGMPTSVLQRAHSARSKSGGSDAGSFLPHHQQHSSGDIAQATLSNQVLQEVMDAERKSMAAAASQGAGGSRGGGGGNVFHNDIPGIMERPTMQQQQSQPTTSLAQQAMHPSLALMGRGSENSNNNNSSNQQQQQQHSQNRSASQQQQQEQQPQGDLPSNVLPPQLLPSFLDAAPDTAQNDRVLWFGNVDKVGKGLGAHRRAAFVTSSAVILALPTGGVTRVIPLEGVGAATVIPPNVIRLEEPGKQDLVLCCADDHARDQLLQGVKSARSAKFPNARPLPVKEDSTLKLGADMSSPSRRQQQQEQEQEAHGMIGRPTNPDSLQPEPLQQNAAFTPGSLSSVLGSIGRPESLGRSGSGPAGGSSNSNAPSASPDRHSHMQHEQPPQNQYKPGSANSFLSSMFPNSNSGQQQPHQQQGQAPPHQQQQYGHQPQQQQPQQSHHSPPTDIPSASGQPMPSHAQLNRGVNNVTLNPVPNPPNSGGPQTVPLSQAMAFANAASPYDPSKSPQYQQHEQAGGQNSDDLSHLYPPASAHPEKPGSAPPLDPNKDPRYNPQMKAEQQQFEQQQQQQQHNTPSIGDIMAGNAQQQQQQQQQYPQSLMQNQAMQQQLAHQHTQPSVLFGNNPTEPLANSGDQQHQQALSIATVNNHQRGGGPPSMSPSYSPASPVPGTSRQLEIAAAAVAVSERGKEQERLASLEEQLSRQNHILEAMRQDRSHTENKEVRDELAHARALIADLQTALKSQESTFAEMLRSQEMLRLSEEARAQKDRELTVLRNDRENMQRQLREKEAAISDLREALQNVERKGHAELERVRQSFVDYDKNVGEYVEKQRLQHLEEMEALRRRLVAEQELMYQQQHGRNNNNNNNNETTTSRAAAGSTPPARSSSRAPIKVHTPAAQMQQQQQHVFHNNPQSAAAAAVSGRGGPAVDPDELRNALLNLSGYDTTGAGGGATPRISAGPPTSFHPNSPQYEAARDHALTAMSPESSELVRQQLALGRGYNAGTTPTGNNRELTGRAAELASGYPQHVVSAARQHLTHNPVPALPTPSNISRRDRSIL